MSRKEAFRGFPATPIAKIHSVYSWNGETSLFYPKLEALAEQTQEARYHLHSPEVLRADIPPEVGSLISAPVESSHLILNLTYRHIPEDLKTGLRFIPLVEEASSFRVRAGSSVFNPNGYIALRRKLTSGIARIANQWMHYVGPELPLVVKYDYEQISRVVLEPGSADKKLGGVPIVVLGNSEPLHGDAHPHFQRQFDSLEGLTRVRALSSSGSLPESWKKEHIWEIYNVIESWVLSSKYADIFKKARELEVHSYATDESVDENGIHVPRGWTLLHEIQTAVHAVEIAWMMNLDEDRLLILACAALVHDVGKMWLDHTLLNDPRWFPRNSYQVKLLRQHAAFGFEILDGLTAPHSIVRVAGSHHEQLDGGGYPGGLTWRELCLLSRILNLADFFTACYEGTRPYRVGGMPVSKILAIMEQGAFDGDVAAALIRIIPLLGDLPFAQAVVGQLQQALYKNLGYSPRRASDWTLFSRVEAKPSVPPIRP